MQSVCRIVEDIQSGRRSARDSLAESFDAIEALDGAIHAFTCIADRQAAFAESGPLAGVAFGVKDIFDTFDLPSEYGSPLYKGWQPRADASLVAMARAAGATVAGKTVTTEMAFFQPGPTVNPHNHAHTPGGSSSGSAAAVAAGMIPAALGTQTGGSIIRPASFCGIAGYKPSFRLSPATGMKTFSWTLDTTGFFAASVADVALFAAHVLARPLQARPVDPLALRIGLYQPSTMDEASEEMREAVAEAALRAAHAGVTVITMQEPEELAEGRAAHKTIQNFEAARALAHEHRMSRDGLSAKLLEALDHGALIPVEAYDQARSSARRARKAATALFEHVDVLLTPSAPGAAPQGLETTGDPAFNKLWTLTGCPCVNVPGLKNAEGLPLGVQITGRFGRDSTVLDAAAFLESLL